MKFVFAFILISFTFTSIAKNINITGTDISFAVPDAFKPLPQKLIDMKWPMKKAPKWVVSNESTSTSIAYDLKPNDISTVPLPKLVNYFKNTFNRIGPGVVWKKAEVIEIHGEKWVYLEFTSNAINADIYNIMLVTSYGNEMVMFNFNSTKEEFPIYEKKLRQSIQSIKLGK